MPGKSKVGRANLLEATAGCGATTGAVSAVSAAAAAADGGGAAVRLNREVKASMLTRISQVRVPTICFKVA
jgi:hypothetical protein